MKELKGNRAVIGRGGVVTAAINVGNLQQVYGVKVLVEWVYFDTKNRVLNLIGNCNGDIIKLQRGLA